MEKGDKKKLLDTAIMQIEKQFGKGSIMRLGDDTSRKDIPVITTGIVSLDIATGIGGFPLGRIVEIFGPESSGKTTIALHVLSEVQKRDGIAAFIDAEHALNPAFAEIIGVKLDELLVSQPSYGEEALEIADSLIRSQAVDVIVVDSVAALVPKAELDGDMGDTHVGLQARLMSQALRKLTGTVAKSRTCLIFINQVRRDIGKMGYGPSETTTGGIALKFYSSMRLETRRIEQIKSGQDIVGIKIRVKVVKNKLAPPFKQVELDISFSKGVDKVADLLQVAVSYEVIKKAGTWYSYKNEKIGQGKDNAIKFLLSRPDVRKEIERIVREKAGLPTNYDKLIRK
jgi:recombination protein RecA